jgi:hypothetical protein
VAETYDVFFLIPDKARAQRVQARWRELLGDHVIAMESPKDTCSVAAAIVGLTETRVADLDALADVLKNNGLDRDHVRSTVRALRDYAALLKNPSARPSRPAATGTRWWNNLFG